MPKVGPVSASVVPPPTKKSSDPIAVTSSSPTAAELKALSKSDPTLANTIRRAQSAWSDIIAKGGRVLVANSAGNGNMPVVTVVPPGFDPSKNATVQTHYHGDRTTAATPHGNAVEAAKELMGKDSQRVFVF